MGYRGRRPWIPAAIALLPMVLSILFINLAPSEGANIGGGMLFFLSIPVGMVLYLALTRKR